MATEIPTGTPAYLTSYATGQGGGVSDYFTFDDDLDTNFVLLRTTINQMIAEISAVQGVNAVFAYDLIFWDDASNPIDPAGLNSGVIGASSYEITVNAGALDIKKGVAAIGGNRVTLVSDLTGVTSSGGAGTRYVAIDFNGQVFIETAAAQQAFDIATVAWDGAIFTGSPTYLAEVFVDGDAWAELRNREDAGGGFGATVFRRVVSRFEALEQTLGVVVGGASVIAVPPGSAATPGLIQKDGAGAADTTTGWFRQAANVWAWAASAVEIVRFLASGIRFSIAGSVGTPILSRTADTDTGLYFPALDQVALTAGGAESVRGASVAAGGAAFPTALRCEATNIGSAQNLTDATWDVIDLDATDVRDVGAWHDPGSNPDQVVCPANGGGLYHVSAVSSFADPAVPDGDRGVRLTLNGTPIPGASVVVQPAAAENTSLFVAADVDLVATDVLRVEMFESDTGAAIAAEATLRVHRIA